MSRKDNAKNEKRLAILARMEVDERKADAPDEAKLDALVWGLKRLRIYVHAELRVPPRVIEPAEVE